VAVLSADREVEGVLTPAELREQARHEAKLVRSPKLVHLQGQRGEVEGLRWRDEPARPGVIVPT